MTPMRGPISNWVSNVEPDTDAMQSRAELAEAKCIAFAAEVSRLQELVNYLADQNERMHRKGQEEMTMPKQRRGKSEQVVQTPPEFLSAVVNKFGPFAFDLAALETNAVAYGYYGPDQRSGHDRDSLDCGWPNERYLWLNPPYAAIAPWAKKCADTVTSSGGDCAHILMLVPASVGANWYRDYVSPFADVYSVGRMKFVGHDDPYPKDLVLCHYWSLGGGKFKHWDWRK